MIISCRLNIFRKYSILSFQDVIQASRKTATTLWTQGVGGEGGNTDYWSVIQLRGWLSSSGSLISWGKSATSISKKSDAWKRQQLSIVAVGHPDTGSSLANLIIERKWSMNERENSVPCHQNLLGCVRTEQLLNAEYEEIRRNHLAQQLQ